MSVFTPITELYLFRQMAADGAAPCQKVTAAGGGADRGADLPGRLTLTGLNTLHSENSF